MLSRLFPGCALLLALAGASCKPDRCRSAAPAFELEVVLPASVEGNRVATLQLTITAAGMKKQATLDMAGKLAGGSTTVEVTVGAPGAAGFAAEVTAEARDAEGRALAGARGSFAATGDACNFFRIGTTPTAGDAAAEAKRDTAPRDARVEPRDRQVERSNADGSQRDQNRVPVTWSPFCPTGSALIGGGASCSAGDWLVSLIPDFVAKKMSALCASTTVGLSTACLVTSAKVDQLSSPPTTPEATTTCYSGFTLLGGGCACDPQSKSAIVASQPVGNGWFCRCAGGPAVAYALCIEGEPFTVTTSKFTDIASVVQAPCLGNVLLGGGCVCSSGSLVAAAAAVNASAWECKCSVGGVMAFALCAH